MSTTTSTSRRTRISPASTPEKRDIFFYISPKKPTSPRDIVKKYSLDAASTQNTIDISTEINSIAYSL